MRSERRDHEPRDIAECEDKVTDLQKSALENEKGFIDELIKDINKLRSSAEDIKEILKTADRAEPKLTRLVKKFIEKLEKPSIQNCLMKDGY